MFPSAFIPVLSHNKIKCCWWFCSFIFYFKIQEAACSDLKIHCCVVIHFMWCHWFQTGVSREQLTLSLSQSVCLLIVHFNLTMSNNWCCQLWPEPFWSCHTCYLWMVRQGERKLRLDLHSVCNPSVCPVDVYMCLSVGSSFRTFCSCLCLLPFLFFVFYIAVSHLYLLYILPSLEAYHYCDWKYIIVNITIIIMINTNMYIF